MTFADAERGLHRDRAIVPSRMTRPPFYLVVWKTPRVRSGRAATAALHEAGGGIGDARFGHSADIAVLLSEMAHEPSVEIGDPMGWSQDRVAFLEMSWQAVDEVGPRIARRCEELGLVLVDIQHERLVVPGHPNAGAWPVRERPGVEVLRDTVARVAMTGDPAVDAKRVHRAVLRAFQ